LRNSERSERRRGESVRFPLEKGSRKGYNFTARKKIANLMRLPRGGHAAARIGFERAFLAKRKRIYQPAVSRVESMKGKRNFL
jgi:hypothetical protein